MLRLSKKLIPSRSKANGKREILKDMERGKYLRLGFEIIGVNPILPS